MNALSFRRVDLPSGPTIDFLVDGESLAGRFGLSDSLLPCRFLTTGALPLNEVSGDPRGRVLLAVCSCGEADCSRLFCRLTRDDSLVILDKFGPDPKGQHSGFRVEINAANYDAVLDKVAKECSGLSTHRPPR